jgi:hypothetical protein
MSLLVVLTFQQVALAKDSAAVHGWGTLERTIAFAIQQEVEAGNLRSKPDLCVGFGQGLDINEAIIVSNLRHSGLQVHTKDWCNQGPRGVRIGIIAPIHEEPPGTYELRVQVDDLSIQAGEHFATILRRGRYVIRSCKASRPKLVSYEAD